jgi:hypothetical protein
MNLFQHRLVRLPIVAIGAAAWLLISNHCALEAIQASVEVPMPSCHAASPAHQAPAQDDQECAVECCKVLRATLLTISKNLAAADTLAFVAHTYVALPVPRTVESEPISIFEWDTGPPGAGFAELVLQQSILAHAPPSLS